jgi:hypothetical protein
MRQHFRIFCIGRGLSIPKIILLIPGLSVSFEALPAILLGAIIYSMSTVKPRAEVARRQRCIFVVAGIFDRRQPNGPKFATGRPTVRRFPVWEMGSAAWSDQCEPRMIVLHTLDTGATVDRPLFVVAIRRLMGLGVSTPTR